MTLVSLTEQLDYEPSVHMLSPHVVTICEPSAAVRKAYLKKMNLTEQDLLPKPQRVILSEEEQVPELPEDDYEPQYVEEA